MTDLTEVDNESLLAEIIERIRARKVHAGLLEVDRMRFHMPGQEKAVARSQMDPSFVFFAATGVKYDKDDESHEWMADLLKDVEDDQWGAFKSVFADIRREASTTIRLSIKGDSVEVVSRDSDD